MWAAAYRFRRACHSPIPDTWDLKPDTRCRPGYTPLRCIPCPISRLDPGISADCHILPESLHFQLDVPSGENVRMTRVAFQGERGAFGEEAVVQYFGDEAEPVPCGTFAQVFQAVAGAQVDYGVVPIENSIAGSVHEVYDLLRQYDLFVRGERIIPIELCASGPDACGHS